MQPEEYARLERVEREHWFYSGKRRIVRHWIKRTMPLQPGSLLLDCGAGTGLFALEMSKHCRVLASDDHADSLRLLRDRLSPDKVLAASCTQLPLADQSIDCLTALDVIEHVADDLAAVKEFQRVLKPDGVAIITVPALTSLWSDWDVALHHFRRYELMQLSALLTSAGFELEYLNYVNVLALPLIWLARKWRAVVPAKKEGSRLEEFIPPWPLNALLRASFVSLACQKAVRFPCGVGLIAVARCRS